MSALNMMNVLLQMALDLMLTLRSHSFEKNQIIHMQLDAFHFMTVISLMPFVLSFYKLLGSLICPLNLSHNCCIHFILVVVTLGNKVQIDQKFGFLAIHEIVWAETCSCTSSTIIHRQ